MDQAGVGDQNRNGPGRRMRSNMNGTAGVGDQNMVGSGRSRRSEHEWIRQE